MNDTLDRVLRRFNLDPVADYSRIAMPLSLNLNRRQLAALFAELELNCGVEIGTEQGEFAETLCKANSNLHLYCVDAWSPYHGYPDHVRSGKLNDFFQRTQERLAPYDCDLIRKYSMDALDDFDTINPVSFVYIDANHRFDWVMRDIIEWSKRVRSGGIIAGHDYTHRQSRDVGVIEAVTAYTGAHRITPYFVCRGEYEREGDRTPSFFWVKP